MRVLGAVLFLAVPHLVWGRMGGGGGFGGGGSFGGRGSFGGGGGFSGGGSFGAGGFGDDFSGALLIFVLQVVVIIIAAMMRQQNYRRTIQRADEAVHFRRSHVAEEALRASDPNFIGDELCDRIRSSFVLMQQAWCDQNLSSVRAFMSDGVHERLSLQIQEQIDFGYQVKMSGLRVSRVAVLDATTEDHFDSVAIAISAVGTFQRISRRDGSPVTGKPPEVDPFTEIWTFMRRKGGRLQGGRRGLMEGHCPNCGAAIQIAQNATCQACGSLLRSGEHDWVLVEITQSSEWKGLTTVSAVGLEEIRQRDPDFALVHLEDKASVMFWRLTMADRLGSVKPMRKSAVVSLCDKFEEAYQSSGSKRSYLGERAVGSADVVALAPAGQPLGQFDEGFDRAFVRVRWAGRVFETDGRTRTKVDQRAIMSDTILVLARKPGVRSLLSRALSSAHCPQCGAPETDTVSPACDYCGTVLNDGGAGWVLLDVMPSDSPEVREALSQTRFRSSAVAAANGEVSESGLIAWMIHTAFLDSQLDERELALIAKVARKHRMRQEAVELLLDSAAVGTLVPPEPSSRAEAKQWLEAITDSALSDGKVTPAEHHLISKAATALGWDKTDIKLMIKHRQLAVYRNARDELKGNRNGYGQKP